MSLAIEVRPARETDCARLGQLRADSITQLCGDDHGHDPKAIADWVGDGSARKFLDLLAQPSVTLIVAERGGQVAGLAARKGDFVTLNYVDPAHRFGGVSKILMLALGAGYGEGGDYGGAPQQFADGPVVLPVAGMDGVRSAPAGWQRAIAQDHQWRPAFARSAFIRAIAPDLRAL